MVDWLLMSSFLTSQIEVQLTNQCLARQSLRAAQKCPISGAAVPQKRNHIAALMYTRRGM
jgi:hypothetical protein